VGDIRFCSKAEAGRYAELLLLFAPDTSQSGAPARIPVTIKGAKVFTYKADFAYFENEKRVIEDVKGFRRPVYKLKKPPMWKRRSM